MLIIFEKTYCLDKFKIISSVIPLFTSPSWVWGDFKAVYSFFNHIISSVIPLFTSPLANGLGTVFLETIHKQKNLLCFYYSLIGLISCGLSFLLIPRDQRSIIKIDYFKVLNKIICYCLISNNMKRII